MRPVARARTSDAAVDAALVRLIVEDRDREAFDALYDRHASAAYGIARRVLRDPCLAEDVVQDVFLGLWTTPNGFDPGRGSLRTWLLTIVHHRSVDAVRREVSRPAVSVDLIDHLGQSVENTEDTALRHADADRVQRALAALPAMQRQALLLAYWGGHTHVEIAGLTGVPIGTVKSRIFKGFQRLRAQLRSTTEGTPGGEQ